MSTATAAAVLRRSRAPEPTALARVAIYAGVAGLLAAIPVLPVAARTVLLLAFVLCGPGSAALTWIAPLPRVTAVALVPLLGLATVVLVTAAAATAQAFSPRLILVILALVSVLAAAVRTRDPLRALRPRPLHWSPGRPRLRGTTGLAAGVLVVAAALWLAALPSLGRAPDSQWGLLEAGSPLFAISLGATVVGFLISVRAGQARVAGAAALLIALQIRLTVTFATSVPFYPWSYKHIAVADYIASAGRVVRDLDVYHDWPGLFSATAWFSRTSGVSVITIAHWFSPIAYVALVGLAWAMARAWDRTPLEAACVAFLTQALSWVSLGYFSPQDTAYVLAFGVLILLPRLRGPDRPPTSLGLGVLTLFAAITVTHQLTPYWLLLMVGLLALLRQIRPWWLPVSMAVVAGTVLLLNRKSIAGFTIFSANPVKNAQTNAPTTSDAHGQQFTSFVSHVASATIWLAAVAVLVAIAVTGWRRAITPTVLAFCPFALVLAGNYGGELIFRVFLFSLPMCALVICPRLVRLIQTHWLLSGPIMAVTVAVAACSAQALFGAWSADRVSKNEVQVAAWLNRTVASGSAVLTVGSYFPTRVNADYVRLVSANKRYDAQLVYPGYLTGQDFSSPLEYQKFSASALKYSPTAVYVVLNKQTQFADWYLGVLPLAAIPNLEAHMNADPRWSVVLRSTDVVVYKANR